MIFPYAPSYISLDVCFLYLCYILFICLPPFTFYPLFYFFNFCYFHLSRSLFLFFLSFSHVFCPLPSIVLVNLACSPAVPLCPNDALIQVTPTHCLCCTPHATLTHTQTHTHIYTHSNAHKGSRCVVTSARLNK